MFDDDSKRIVFEISECFLYFILSLLCKLHQEKKSLSIICQLLWTYSNGLVSIGMSSVDPEERGSVSALFQKLYKGPD